MTRVPDGVLMERRGVLPARKPDPNGVLGDPTGANAEVGRRLAELQVQSTVSAIKAYLGEPHA
jgi:creatinine amidohydrolase/Fe(II)-dependent formamide hydrolase-like protein